MKRLRKVLWENGLTLALLGFFVFSWAGQILTGMADYNDGQKDHGAEPTTLWGYLHTGHFVEATAENWESEFLQMGAFILFTVWLRQKGSSESKKMEGGEDVDHDPAHFKAKPDAPWPVRRGGIWLRLYSHSLSIAFISLFVISFLLHAAGGSREYSREQMQHGEPGVTMLQFMGSSKFWFQSFQNWQSEFLSIAAMVVLTIFLREKGSPESKPVDAPLSKTGK